MKELSTNIAKKYVTAKYSKLMSGNPDLIDFNLKELTGEEANLLLKLTWEE